MIITKGLLKMIIHIILLSFRKDLHWALVKFVIVLYSSEYYLDQFKKEKE